MERTMSEQIIADIEAYATVHELNHRFVGGVSFGGLVNKKTTAEILFPEKVIRLHQHNTESLVRADKSIRDIDMILFCEDKKKITAFTQFLMNLRKTYSNSTQFPDISVEPTLYPTLGKRNTFAQFVTALEVDKHNQLFLSFEQIRQPISWQSVESWIVELETGLRFTVRNPIADYYAYLFRSPAGPKPKDSKKLRHLKAFVDIVAEAGKQHDPAIDYYADDYYNTWLCYIESLQKTSDPVVTMKKFWLLLYWQTIGTLLAHNFSRYGNNFTGMK